MKFHHLFFLVISLFDAACKESDNIVPFDPGDISSVKDIQIFTASHLLNRDVSSDPVDANSNAILELIGVGKGLFADFEVIEIGTIQTE